MSLTHKDFVDTFQYVDTLDIKGLISESGHEWTKSGVNLPAIEDNQLVSTGVGGNYAFIDVRKDPFYQYADLTVDNDSTSGIVLMASNRDIESLNWMTHFRFTNTALSLQMRGLGDGAPNTPPPISDANIEYSTPMVTGNTYRVGVYFHQTRFVIDLPDGNQYEFAHQKFADVVGQQLCFQPLNAKLSKTGCILNHRNVIAP